MSEGRASNKEVIDELTSGLADCMKARLPNTSATGDFGEPQAGATTAPDPSGADKDIDPTDQSAFEDAAHFGPARERFGESTSRPKNLDNNDYDSDHKEESDHDEDYVDEEALKEECVGLTEDQREERKIIAEGLKKNGNDAYKNGDFELSIEKYTDGLRQCPVVYTKERAILYCNRSAAKMKLERYKTAIEDCTKSLELDDKYIKAYIRRAQSYESSEKLDEALADFARVLELAPQQAEARRAAERLPPLIAERNEKLKTEMLGKLKELGNMVLKPFGLSTDNFQMNQDPETKGYSINFKQ